MAIRVGGEGVEFEPDPPRGEFMPFNRRKGHWEELFQEDDGVEASEGNEIRMMRIASIDDDRLQCDGGSVAKPYLLQKTPWDGETVVIDGISVTYEYQDDGSRIARGIVNEGSENEEEIVEVQKITQDYRVGDFILVANNVDMPAPMSSADWVDLNFGARAWAVEE